MVKPPNHHDDSDANAIHRLAQGNLDALGPLYERYGGEVRSLLLRTEPSLGRAGADDLCQEVFLTLVDTVNRYEHQGKLKSWLYGIAVRKARAWRRRRWVRVVLGQRHGTAVSGVAIQSDRLEERVSARQRIETALAILPNTQREVIVLRMIEGLSGEETAQVLGISENAVGTRLHRARATMGAMT
jgi:RNA polymerase sigma factor (sigma-70 family)